MMNFSPTQSISPNEYYPSSTDVNAAGKSRSRRPCDSCRRRKSRCEIVEGAPPCVLCRFHRQECTFLEDPQPRKRKAASLSEEEHSSKGESTRRPPSLATQEAVWVSGRSPAATVAAPPKIRQDQPVDNYANLKGFSLLKKTLGLQNHRHSRLIGSTSVYEHLLLELSDYHNKEEVPVGTSALRKVNSLDAAFILTPDEGTRNHEDEIPDLDVIETLVAPHGQALVHLYFRIVHPSFPILHKKVFLEKYNRTHREFSPPLLAAVYILALNWWTYSSELALLPKPDVPRLEKLAFKTMNDIIHRPKLSTIQAGLLLLQRPEGDSWALTTQLVGIGQELGLHLDCSNWRIPSWERRLRKRLAWALFMQDKWGALVHGRPSHIMASDWAVKPLLPDDFPENAADDDNEDGSTEVEKGRALFCEMIRLTEILGSILSNFYTLQAEEEFRLHARDGVRWLLEKANPIQSSLKHWFDNLPPSLRMEDIAMRKLSSTGYLHLGYYAVGITLHRQIIRSLSSVDDPSLRSICRQAANARLKSAMEFVKSLRPEHLQSFWYSASKYCFALIGTFISLLWVTAQDKEEADLYKAKLDEYRWMLRLSSKSADFLERAISMLATSTGILVKAIPDKPNLDFILNRHQHRTISVPVAIHLEHQAPPPPYDQSESEAHEDDPSSGEVSEETPSPSAVATGEWNPDSLWFSGSYLEMSHLPNGYDFNGFTAHGQMRRESGE
ncbi:fungal-specific transcription factor domain-domain-containing protein [Clohesyomyces aquaticus]|uniref:Fungal-specific transcription factor domain-domain-containing protein n=1 Tax=Clohesyomyces aquaticus TaxID=1231657 RepID=A0A1Y2A681_9PLEO|nr:fungal-specific transcription factor domain-domain-containing protein [Clohesyomyces aquaticus]